MMTRSLILSLSLCSAAFAQVGGPVLGYVPESGSIRTMYGLPAAGAIGALLHTGRQYSQITISPAQNFALAIDAGAVIVIKPGVSNTALTGVSANPSIIAISPSGTSAALWISGAHHIQVVTGLPDSPSVATIDASFLNASPSALAVTDDGQFAVGLFSAGVYAFGASAQVTPLQTDPGIVAIAFSHNNHNLSLANAARATTITDVGGANQPSVLFDYSAQSLSPIAMATSFDNQYTVIADASGKILNLDSAAAFRANTVDCGCTPTGVYSLGSSIFRLTGTGGPKRNSLEKNGPTSELKIFDASAGAVWIVPPSLTESGARQ